jgi:uncharacterized membrane protein (DUF485 family)
VRLPSTPPAATGTDWIAVRDSPEFADLHRRRARFVVPLTIGFLAWYLAYVLLADYAHGFMSTPVFGRVNLGLLLGLAQFVTTFVITTVYVRFADRNLDPVGSRIRDRVDAESAARTDGIPR